jgi:starch phosphorylase
MHLMLRIRDQLIRNWNETQQFHTKIDCKRVYYLSLEFLMGRSLDNTLLNMNSKEMYSDALSGLGFRMENVLQEERDAALGNGGLGRLAACFMDSLATMDYPAWGYGLRYTYGIFRQKIRDGFQNEFPDYWLTFGNPWEMPRLDVAVSIPDASIWWSSTGM